MVLKGTCMHSFIDFLAYDTISLMIPSLNLICWWKNTIFSISLYKINMN